MTTYRLSKNDVAQTGVFANLTTTVNTFVDVGTLVCAMYKTKRFVFLGATQTLSVKILGSIDGGATYPYTEVAAFDVAAAATVPQTFTTFYSHVKVQVQPKVAGVHGTLTTNWGMATW